MSVAARSLWTFDDSYARALPGLSVPWTAAPAPAPDLLVLNEELAAELGLDAQALREPAGVALLVGNAVPDGVSPVAQAYAGHQFGGYVPRLGDGRALLVGELVDRRGHRRDLHLKGSGRTPFARGGDGKAAVGPMLREYVVAEAMHALGIPTTRALAVVATGEQVVRETMLPGAVLARVAASHLRVGTFQYAAAQHTPAQHTPAQHTPAQHTPAQHTPAQHTPAQHTPAQNPAAQDSAAQDSAAAADPALVRALADYAIARHHPGAAESPNPYLDLYRRIVDAQAALVARWMLVGFVHGVMNTDNMTISGETIDFGPCAFLDSYDPATVFSSIDYQGRYAYGNQPQVAQWNLARLGETLLPLIDERPDASVEAATAVLHTFTERYESFWAAGMAAKLGLDEPDGPLFGDVLVMLAAERVDFTQFFRALSSHVSGRPEPVRSLFGEPQAFDAWAGRWQALLPRDRAAVAAFMDEVNPVYIPRNHRVEEALAAATGGDLALFGRLVEVLARPFVERPGLEGYRGPAPASADPHVTYCGT